MADCARCNGRGWTYEYDEDGTVVGQSECDCVAGEIAIERRRADAAMTAIRAFLAAHDSGRSVRDEMAKMREVVG